MNYPFFFYGNLLIIALYVLLLMVFMHVFGGMSAGTLLRRELILSQLLAVLVTDGFAYPIVCLIGRRLLPVLPFILLAVYGFVCAFVSGSVTAKVYPMLFKSKRMLLVHNGGSAAALVMKMCSRTDRCMICRSVHISDGLPYMEKLIARYDAVLISLPDSPERSGVIRLCSELDKPVWLRPDVQDIILRGAAVTHLFDAPLLISKRYALTFEQAIVKRIADIVIASIGLLIALPFMLVCALFIKLYDGGNVFYCQTRLTLDGREFKLIKLRSMVMNAEKNTGAALALADDSRITPVGKVLRRWRADEIPQLINVLRGEMSVVGPRPERPELAAEYTRELPEFPLRLKVKAGLTGYAQVYGRYSTTPYDKLLLDLMYIESFSLLTDLRLMIATVKALFLPESSQGIEESR